MRKRPSVDKLTSSRHETPWKCKVSLDYCEIWENSQSRVIAEAYPIWNGDGSRSHTSFRLPHVVECIGVYGSPQKYVLIERIPSRLSEVSILNEAQTLKVLCATFRGLANLQPNFGYFGLTESCICFSQSGIVKIWVNPNLSILTPIRSFEPQYNITNRIIDQVIRMIQKKCFNPMLLFELRQQIEEEQNFNFEAAAEFVEQLADNLFLDIKDHRPSELIRNRRSHEYYQKSQPSTPSLQSPRGFTDNTHSYVDPKYQTNQHRRNNSASDNMSPFQFVPKTNFSSTSPPTCLQTSRHNSCYGSKLRKFNRNSEDERYSKFSQNIIYAQRKRSIDTDNRILQVTHSGSEDGDNSFAKGLKIKQTQSKKQTNDFQTFGNLDNADADIDKPTLGTIGDLDLAKMDEQIQKKLISKGRSKNRKPSLEEISFNTREKENQTAHSPAEGKRKEEPVKSGFSPIFRRDSSSQYTLVDDKYEQSYTKNQPFSTSSVEASKQAPKNFILKARQKYQRSTQTHKIPQMKMRGEEGPGRITVCSMRDQNFLSQEIRR